MCVKHCGAFEARPRSIGSWRAFCRRCGAEGRYLACGRSSIRSSRSTHRFPRQSKMKWTSPLRDLFSLRTAHYKLQTSRLSLFLVSFQVGSLDRKCSASSGVFKGADTGHHTSAEVWWNAGVKCGLTEDLASLAVKLAATRRSTADLERGFPRVN